MAQGSSNPILNLAKLAGTNISVSSGVADLGTQRIAIADDQYIITEQIAYGIFGVNIVGTSGQFTCTEDDVTPLIVGQQITISGTLSGTGSITGYTDAKAYIISQTNGYSSFTLTQVNGNAIVTSVGTTNGLTFATRAQQDFNIIGAARESILSINDKLSNGTQKSIIRSGVKGSSVSADVTSTPVSSSVEALDVTLKTPIPTGDNTIGKLAANDGVDIGDVTINNTSIAVTDNGGSLTVDGTVGISGTVPVTGTFWQATQPVSISSAVPVTDNGGSLTVDGSVSVSNFPATQAVSISTLPALAAGTNTIGKVDVNGTVPVSGTFWQATQPISGTVAISGTVPISGALTDTQLRASAVAVTGTFWQATQPVSIATLPTLAAGTNNIGDVDVASLPGTVAADITAIKTATELLDNALGTDGGVVSTGMLRVGGTDGINNQTLSVNNLGHLNIADGGNSITVDGTFWQATQPVSLASVPSHPVTNAGTFAVQATQAGTWNISSITSLPALAAGTNNIGDVDVASLPGTVAADITAIKVATELLDNALGTDGSTIATTMLRVGGTDGTNNQTLSVNTAGHVNIADGGNSITVDGTVGISGTVPVSGTFWQATQPVSISSAVPVTDNGGSLTVDGSVSVSNFPATQAVSGTVAISGTVPISGALTDTQLRASAVAVSLASVPSHPVTNAGTFAVQATQAGTWNIGSITSLPALAAGTNNIGSVSLSPNALVANAPTNASTTAYAASLIVKASAGVLYIITGFNSRSSGQFIQIFDSATLPADTSVPKVIFYVESNSNFSFDLGAYGRAFSSGIVICNSSTGPTKKIGAADCWFDVQYK